MDILYQIKKPAPSLSGLRLFTISRIWIKQKIYGGLYLD